MKTKLINLTEKLRKNSKFQSPTKIYTFPKIILSISDIVRSSQEENDSMKNMNIRQNASNEKNIILLISLIRRQD